MTIIDLPSTPMQRVADQPAAATQPPEERHAGWQLKAGMLLVVAVATILSLGLAVFHAWLPELVLGALAPTLATTVAIMLAGFPLVIGFVQAISRDRQMGKLAGIAAWPVAETTSYALALTSLRSLRPASVTEPDYRFPMLCFCFTVVLCTLSVSLFYSFPEMVRYRSVILGGVHVLDIGALPDPELKAVYDYQAGTFTAIAFAFFGAYITVIHRLLARIINNDVYPVSFHIYTAWILTAGVVAGVVRHVTGVFGGDVGPAGVVLIGFVVGLAPNRFVVSIARRVFDKLSILGDKRDPGEQLLPSNKNLLMIDGLDTDQIDRLAELGVTNAQVLAAQNPLVLWPRLPFELGLLVNWIAQAQLYVRVGEAGLVALRDSRIGDVFDFQGALLDPAAQARLCAVVKLDPALAPALLASLTADPGFARLKAVRDAMATSSAGPAVCS